MVDKKEDQSPRDIRGYLSPEEIEPQTETSKEVVFLDPSVEESDEDGLVASVAGYLESRNDYHDEVPWLIGTADQIGSLLEHEGVTEDDFIREPLGRYDVETEEKAAKKEAEDEGYVLIFTTEDRAGLADREMNRYLDTESYDVVVDESAGL